MSARFVTLVLGAVSQFAWFPIALAQPVPVGPEFQVNTYTTGSQLQRAIASDGAGDFVVVWAGQGSTGTYSSSIQGQRYDGAGTLQGSEFQVNTYTTNYRFYPVVAADAVGNFLVVWHSFAGAGTDTSGISIQGQRYNMAGAPQGGEFQVNTYTTGDQSSPAVAADGAGNFVVVWNSVGSAATDTDESSVQGQRYDSAGAPQGSEFQVNTYTTGGQYSPAVAADGAGNFVVVWQSAGSAGTDSYLDSVQGQRYDSAGAPQGGEFQVNTYTSSTQDRPKVAADTTGDFVVVWRSQGSAGTDSYLDSVQGQRYDSAGAPQGSEFQVNTYTTGYQKSPDVAADAAGNIVVVWGSSKSAATDTDGYSVQGQVFDSAGAPLGPQFQANTYTTSVQYGVAVAANGAGNFVVVWQSDGSAGTDTSSGSVQAQRFSISTTSHLLPGRSTIIKPGALVKFVAKPITGDGFALPTANPPTSGGSLRVYDANTTAGDDTYPLPTGGWRGLGTPSGSKGWKYKGAGSLSDPCRLVLLKEKVIKAACVGSGVVLTPPFSGDVGITLDIGTSDRYCAEFGGDEVKNDATLTKRKNAPAPGACP